MLCKGPAKLVVGFRGLVPRLLVRLNGRTREKRRIANRQIANVRLMARLMIAGSYEMCGLFASHSRWPSWGSRVSKSGNEQCG